MVADEFCHFRKSESSILREYIKSFAKRTVRCHSEEVRRITNRARFDLLEGGAKMKCLNAIAGLALLVTGIQSFAATTTCSDPTAEWRYEAYEQEGGPCCGRSSYTLTHKRTALKSVEIINGRGGPDEVTDSDPTLSLSFSENIDLNNTSVENQIETRHHATNLVLSRTNGGPIIPNCLVPSLTVSLVCSQTHSLIPIP
jgi:hypothetical protein